MSSHMCEDIAIGVVYPLNFTAEINASSGITIMPNRRMLRSY